MGSGISQDEYYVLEEDQGQPKNSQMKTLPREFDPRSPSNGIFRTPIQITATPDRLLDPRSPSVGIDRTPIYLAKVESEVEVCKENLENCKSSDATTNKKGIASSSPNFPIFDLSIAESLSDAVIPSVVDIRTEPVIYEDRGEFQAARIPGESGKLKSLLQPNLSRSPLTTRNVDAGSLRSMVQLREAKKAEIFLSCQSSGDLRSRKGSAVNKENL